MKNNWHIARLLIIRLKIKISRRVCMSLDLRIEETERERSE